MVWLSKIKISYKVRRKSNIEEDVDSNEMSEIIRATQAQALLLAVLCLLQASCDAKAML